MRHEKDTVSKVHFRQITERFCAKKGDNVVVMQTVTSDGETFKCMSAETCENCSECKNNL